MRKSHPRSAIPSTAYRRSIQGERLIGAKDEESPWDSLVGGLLLGSEEWVEQIRSGLVGTEKEQRELRALKKRPTWKSVVGALEAVKGERCGACAGAA